MTDAATALRSNLYALREFISRAQPVTIGAAAENAHRDLDEVMMAVGEAGPVDVEDDRPAHHPTDGWNARVFRGWACMLLGISASEAQTTTIAKLAGAVADLVPLTTETASDDPPAQGGNPTGPGWWWVRGVSGWQPVEVFEFSGGLRIETEHEDALLVPVMTLDEHEWDGPCTRGVPRLTEADDWAKVLLALGLVDNASPAAARSEIQRRACDAAHVRDALARTINEHGGECEPGKVSLTHAWDMFEAEVLPGRVDGSALPAGSAMLAELWGALNVTPGPSSGWREVVDQVSRKTVGHARVLAALNSAGRFMRSEARTIEFEWLAPDDVEMPKVREGLAKKAEVWHRAAAKILGAS